MSFDLSIVSIVRKMPPSSHVTSGSSAGPSAPAQASSVPRSRASSELMDHTRRRLFSPSGDNEETNELDATSSSGEEDGVAKFKRPDVGRSLAGCQLAEDKEHENLMAELRVLAAKVLREDEWKYRSSDEILGFRD